MQKGKFITFEGGEGAGKTTQAKFLQKSLEQAGIEVLVTREPGGTFGAEAIRDLVLEGSHERWSGMTELLLMYAARIDHVEKLIKPALNRGVWVLCDRFSDSSMAYQGYARGLGPDKVAAIHKIALGDFAPDLTFLFDMDPILALRRVKARGEDLSRFDTEDLDFHKKLREAFKQIAKNNKNRMIIIDASCSKEAIATRIRHEIMQNFTGLQLG